MDDDVEQRLRKLEAAVLQIRSLLRDIRDQGARSEERDTRDSRNVAYMVGHPVRGKR